MAKIIDEKQIDDTRLLFLDENPPKNSKGEIKIDGIKYKSLIVYDCKHSIAIICSPSTDSVIGKNVTV